MDVKLTLLSKYVALLLIALREGTFEEKTFSFSFIKDKSLNKVEVANLLPYLPSRIQSCKEAPVQRWNSYLPPSFVATLAVQTENVSQLFSH